MGTRFIKVELHLSFLWSRACRAAFLRTFLRTFLIEKIYLREINTLHKIPDRIRICVKRRGVLRYFIEDTRTAAAFIR